MISLGINILVIPLSFIGGMATDSPGSTMHDFWEVFFFIQVFPFPLVLLSLVWWLVRRKKQKFMYSVFNANKLSVWATYYIYY